MAQLFDPLVNNQYISQHVGLPKEELDELGTALQTQYYTNLDAADKLEVAINNLDVRAVNQPLVQAQLAKTRESLAGVRERGDWENASMQIRQTAKDFALNKELTGALKDKANFDAWQSEMQEGLQDGTYNKDQYNYYLEQALQANQSPVSLDPDTGVVSNIFNFGKPTQDMSNEIRDYMTELSKLWKEDTRDNPVAVTYKGKDGKPVQGAITYRDGTTGAPPGYYDIQQQRYISEVEVREAMTNAVMGDPKYRAFVEESARIKLWEASKQNGGVFTVDDLASDTNPNAVFSNEELVELEKSFINQGKDFDAMLADPDMVKALYLLGTRNVVLNGMIDAPVQATAFEATEHKFLTDFNFVEALKLRNDLAKIRAKGAQDRKTKAAEAEYNKQPFVIKNRGPVTDRKRVNHEDIALTLQERKTRLAQIESDLNRHRNSDSANANNVSQLANEANQLRTQIAIQESQLKSRAQAYLDTPEGDEFIRKAYQEYEENRNPNIGIVSFDQFKKGIIEGNGVQQGFMSRLKEAASDIWSGVAPGSGVGGIMRRTHNKLMSKLDDVAAQYPGYSGSTYDAEDQGQKSAIYRQANEAKTTYYKQNRTGFYIPNENGGNLGAAEWEAELRKKYGDQNVDVKIVTSDADHSTNGVALFPDKIAVIDKKTGETLREDWIYPIDGGADELLQIGLRGRNEFNVGTPEWEDATRMAALATYQNIITNDLNEASNYVKPGSGERWEGEPIDLPGPMGTVRVKPVRVDEAYYDPVTGAKIGNDAVWMLQVLDNQGNPGAYVPNMTYFDNQGNITGEVNNTAQAYQFKNLNDAKVAMFKMNNPQ